MQLTNIQVLNVLQALNVLGQKKLPMKLSWRIATAVRSLEPFAKAVDEPMKDIRMKYALRDHLDNLVEAVNEKGEPVPNTITIPNDKLPLLNAEMEELLSQTVEVSNVTLKLSDFPDTLELEPALFNVLMPIIDDKTTELNLVK